MDELIAKIYPIINKPNIRVAGIQLKFICSRKVNPPRINRMAGIPLPHFFRYWTRVRTGKLSYLTKLGEKVCIMP